VLTGLLRICSGRVHLPTHQADVSVLASVLDAARTAPYAPSMPPAEPTIVPSPSADPPGDPGRLEVLGATDFVPRLRDPELVDVTFKLSRAITRYELAFQPVEGYRVLADHQHIVAVVSVGELEDELINLRRWVAKISDLGAELQAKTQKSVQSLRDEAARLNLEIDL
jgi:hypothetical protein